MSITNARRPQFVATFRMENCGYTPQMGGQNDASWHVSWYQRLAIMIAFAGFGLNWAAPLVVHDLELTSNWTNKLAWLTAAPCILLGLKDLPKKGFWRTTLLPAMVLMMGAGILWTEATEMNRAYSYFAAFAFTLPLSAIICVRGHIRLAMSTFGWTSCASALWLLTEQMGERWGTVIGRPGFGAFTNADQLGHQFTLAVFMFLMLWNGGAKRLQKTLVVIPIVILFICCVLTASRTAAIALAGGVVVAWIFSAIRNTSRAVLVLAAILLLGLTGFGLDSVATGRPFYADVLERFGEDDTATLGGRQEIWGIASDAFLRNGQWLSGSGTGGVERYLGQWPSSAQQVGADGLKRLYPHNTLIWVALAFGIPGLVIGAALTAKIVGSAYIRDTQEYRMRCPYLTVLVLIGCSCALVMEPYFQAAGAILWAVLSEQSRGRTAQVIPVLKAYHQRRAAIGMAYERG